MILITQLINIFTSSIFYSKRKIQKNNYLQSKECVFTKIHDISKTFDLEVLNVEYNLDHIHMIFTSKPTLYSKIYHQYQNTLFKREPKQLF
jgi:REP element-mobilizing transposase RayT